ncbi:hypothetical protein [Azospirillum sp.]|uniref:hypothetical protein n=1 Tax=Azospirillum sp. TaxID=34012 RepID=UPI003D74AA75
MRIVYVHSGTASAAASLLSGHAVAITDARILHDSSADAAGRDMLLAILADGDELLVPGVDHLGGTAGAVLASLRRAADARVRVTILCEDLDGAAIVQAAALLAALPTADDAPEPRKVCRSYGRATPERVARILALSAGGTPVRAIAAAVGLSIPTVMRVRRIHRASRASSQAAGCLGSVH